MSVFYLYADESGKLKKSDYTSFCGFVAPDTEWWRIATEWEGCVFKWGCPPIHMVEVMHPELRPDGAWAALRKEWGDEWDRRRNDMLSSFAGVIRGSNVVCVGNAVDAEHFRNMPDSDYKQGMKDPLYLSFYHLVRNAIDAVDRLSAAHHLSIIVDDDQEYSLNCYRLLNEMRAQFPDEVGNRISEMGFGNDVAYPGLQAADMIAYESRNLLIARKADASAKPSQLYGALTLDGLHQPTLFTPHFLNVMNGTEKL